MYILIFEKELWEGRCDNTTKCDLIQVVIVCKIKVKLLM